MKCKQCGGPCRDLGNGKIECEYCGSVFSNEDLASTSIKTVKQVNSGTDVFDKNINGVLEIRCSGLKSRWSGSGYIISKSGYAITNAHVAAEDSGEPCKDIIVSVSGQSVPATVVALADDKAGSGRGIDLAIIKLSSMPRLAAALSFASSDAKNGETVFAIGNSLGEGTCITRGIVSDKLRDVNGKKFIMTDCAVNGGNSGGPLFNAQGLVIGTITLQGRTHNGADAEGMNYAIPAETVKRFIEETSRNKRILI